MLCLTQKVEHSIYDLWGRIYNLIWVDLKLLSECIYDLWGRIYNLIWVDLKLLSECLSITMKLIFD